MKRIVFLPAIVFGFFCQVGVGQTDTLPAQFISAQAITRLDNLIPEGLVGFSLQYERSIYEDRSIVGRVVWFRSPFFDGRAVEGFAFSAEYRFYFSTVTMNWHLGPFVEWSTYKAPEYTFGNFSGNSVDIGVLVGHKWVKNQVSFDISVRTAWYGQRPRFAGGFFPYAGEFNSHLLISIGYAIR